jgi:Domain of unknown function (DUF4276)
MARLLVHVEGETEETFVNELIAPHLLTHGFTFIAARKLGTGRQRDKRHGIKPWSVVKEVICDQLTHDTNSYATLMVDYYGLPATGQRAWPGREQSIDLAHENKANHVEQLLYQDIQATITHSEAIRFVPFVVMHEFEALLFSDCAALASGINKADLTDALLAIRKGATSPEHINDSPQTAPSKRLAHLIPQYENQKPLLGNLAALEIGLATMRRECHGFNQWLTQLEAIGASAE